MEPFKKLTEEEAERLLVGKPPAGSDLSEVASFIAEVRSSYAGDLDPALEAAHVATMLEAARTTENGEPFARAASNVTGPERQVAELPKWRRRLLGSASGALAVKILGGAVALAASTVGLAAADLLPEEAQTPVADVVNGVTGLDLPGGTNETEVEEPKVEEDDSDLAGEEQTEGSAQEHPDNFGKIVSEMARQCSEDKVKVAEETGETGVVDEEVAQAAKDCGVDGQVISEMARARAAARQAEHKPEAVPTNTPVTGADEGPGNAPEARPQPPVERPAGSNAPDSVPAGPKQR